MENLPWNLANWPTEIGKICCGKQIPKDDQNQHHSVTHKISGIMMGCLLHLVMPPCMGRGTMGKKGYFKSEGTQPQKVTVGTLLGDDGCITPLHKTAT